MKTIIIGISGINAVDNPGPGVGIARALKAAKDFDTKIAGLAYDAMEPGIYMDWLIDKSFIIPYPSSGKQSFIDRLEYIKNSYGLDFVIPNLDIELPLYIKYSHEIEALGIKTFLPNIKQFRIRGKDKLEEVAEKINIQIPETIVVNSYDEMHKAISKISLPVMIKGAFYKAYRAYTSQEAAGFYNEIVAEWGYPIIIQKVVSGEEMNVMGVGDGKGNSLGLFGIKKMWVTSLGKIWTGVTIKNEKMLAAAKTFVKEYKWKGPFELECIVNEEDIYLIEINPRFPAWSFFAAGVGLNLPANMVRKAFDLPIPEQKDYKTGKLYIRYTYETITDMQPFQQIMTKGEL